jgi:hypothetical protein
MRPILKGDQKYYEYVLVYVDDLFVVSFDPMKTMQQLQECFTFKEGSVKEPDNFLGAQLSFNTNQNRNYWVVSAAKYIEAACKTVEEKWRNDIKLYHTTKKILKVIIHFPIDESVDVIHHLTLNIVQN